MHSRSLTRFTISPRWWTISIEEPIKQDLRLICIYTVIIIIIIIIISIILITILITIAITYSHVIIIAPYCTSIP